VTVVQPVVTPEEERYRRRFWAAALALFAVCAPLRLGLVDRHGLWADELFSLAIATGHSMEHPADRADPTRGDYVEAPLSLPPAAYRRYLEHDSPPAGPTRVVRAVFLSDTSPPLYYLLLYGWTLVLGTSDAALRLFSVAWALACFPLIGSLARQMGGRPAVLPALALLTFAPRGLFYSTEGRMYSLLWFWTVSSMWLTLRLQRSGFRPGPYTLWVLTGAAGLLTHYFFGFVWLAGVGWLFLDPGRFSRKWLCGGVAAAGLLALPWYAQVPELLANWRVTADWLKYPPPRYIPFIKELSLPWSFLSLVVDWGMPVWVDGINLAIYLALAVLVWRKLSWRLFSPRRRLLWFWLLGACLGPLVFDLLLGTYTLAHGRYAIAGMPAAFVLVGVGLGRLRPRRRAAFLALIVLACLVGVGRVYANNSRNYEPFRQLGRLLAEQAGPSDLVIVHSIPSGVVGVARYMDRGGASREGVGFASWVGRLGQRRIPEDLQSLAAGRKQDILVKIHDVGEPAPEEDWLRENATLTGEVRLEAAQVLSFHPRDGETFSRDPLREPLRGPRDTVLRILSPSRQEVQSRPVLHDVLDGVGGRHPRGRVIQRGVVHDDDLRGGARPADRVEAAAQFPGAVPRTDDDAA
jgi:4-amino-4-deoxy-L-arabinose transferase-like glycosyltransferase